MAEYIEREATCQDCVHYDICVYHLKGNENKECVHFQNKADVVEVVRCQDCDVPHNKWLGCPNLNGLIPPPDFYCAKGERKDAKVDGKGEGE
jgi:hypothetical protein